jgi:hypothetical protein
MRSFGTKEVYGAVDEMVLRLYEGERYAFASAGWFSPGQY